MALTTKDLREKRTRLAEEAGTILKTALGEGREGLRSDEHEKWTAYHADIDKLKVQIDALEKQEDLERSLDETQGRQTQPNALPAETRSSGALEHAGASGGSAAMKRLRLGAQDQVEGLRAWFLSGSDVAVSDERRAAAERCGINLGNRNLHFNLPSIPLKNLRAVDEWWTRAQSVGVPSGGGYTVPDETTRAIEVAMLSFGGMREVATILRTDTGADLPIPTSNDTANKGHILAENAQVQQQDITFSQLVLQAYKYSSKMVLVSVELLQDSAVNLPEFIGARLGERIGRILNDHFTTGTGTGQPRGVVTAAAEGAPAVTGQQLSVAIGDLLTLEHSIDPAYRSNARWMFNDATLAALKRLEDDAGRPLWATGMSDREPDRILGYPYIINQSMPTMGADAKSILFGDFSKYLIREARGITLLRLDERFADFHQVAFLAFSRHDGDLLDAGSGPIKYYVNAGA